MYKKHIESRTWSLEVVSENRDELGGYKEIVAEASGQGIFNTFKLESGVHRVQRIPETEKAGRIHTSTATVVVLPVVKNVEFEVSEKDLEIEFTHSSGPGGQNVNKLETAVRIKHLPTGLVVTSQSQRQQHQNKERALEILKSKLYQLKLEEEQAKLGSERKKQVSTADRSEKIRTYNFPQDRITDHRIKQSWSNLPSVLEGDLPPIIAALQNADQQARLSGL